MRALVTGGAGFIGANLVRLLLRRGHSVTVLDDFSTGLRSNLDGLAVTVVEGSVEDPVATAHALAGVDVVAHLGALGSVPRSIADPRRSHEANATGTLALLEAVRQSDVSYLLMSSSSSVYGSNPELPKHERSWVRPMSPYAVTKLAAEQYVLAYQQSFGLQTLAFRFFNVFGPGQRWDHVYAAVIPKFVRAMLDGKPLTVHGDGTQSRDFTYVADVSALLCEALERKVVSPEPVNLAFGVEISLNEIIEELESIFGRPAVIQHGDVRPGDVPHSQSNPARLRELFPTASRTPLREALMATVAWAQGGSWSS